MRMQTKIAALGALVLVALSTVTIMALFDDAEGPLIYEVDILPVSPKGGDMITVSAYCIDASGVSSAKMSWSINEAGWVEQDMVFYACLCLAGGRWIASFGPVSASATVRLYVTAYDSTPGHNSANTQTFQLQIAT